MSKKKIVEFIKNNQEPIIVGIIVLITIYLLRNVNIPKSIRYIMIFVGLCLIILGEYAIRKKKK